MFFFWQGCEIYTCQINTYPAAPPRNALHLPLRPVQPHRSKWYAVKPRRRDLLDSLRACRFCARSNPCSVSQMHKQHALRGGVLVVGWLGPWWGKSESQTWATECSFSCSTIFNQTMWGCYLHLKDVMPGMCAHIFGGVCFFSLKHLMVALIKFEHQTPSHTAHGDTLSGTDWNWDAYREKCPRSPLFFFFCLDALWT